MRVVAFAGLAATLLLGAGTATQAASRGAGANPFMPMGMTVEAPRGYTDMCRIRPQLCRELDPRGPVQVAEVAPTPARQDAGADLSTSSVSASLFLEAGFVTPAFLSRAFVAPALLRAPPTVELEIAPPPPPAPAPAPVVEAPRAATMSAEARMKMLQDVNRMVNGRVRAATDMTNYGVEELWNRTGVERGAVGDCEDFAIEKREQLIARGYPAGDLFFAVAFRSDLGLHAVLVARTERGDYVLDNRSGSVSLWEKAPYVWVKRQSQENPMLWGLVDQPPPRAPRLQVAALSPGMIEATAAAER